LISSRNPTSQAVYTIKGKPLNVAELKRDALYKNDELYNLMRALNIEETVDNLNYNHVAEGHLKILETPLFRVRNKKETIYCYSEAARDEAMEKLGKSFEVTRFKGLGEISPKEFKGFIGEDSIKLTPVGIDDNQAVPHIMKFYMGKNSPERKAYIMKHLVVEVDEAV